MSNYSINESSLYRLVAVGVAVFALFHCQSRETRRLPPEGKDLHGPLLQTASRYAPRLPEYDRSGSSDQAYRHEDRPTILPPHTLSKYALTSHPAPHAGHYSQTAARSDDKVMLASHSAPILQSGLMEAPRLSRNPGSREEQHFKSTAVQHVQYGPNRRQYLHRPEETSTTGLEEIDFDESADIDLGIEWDIDEPERIPPPKSVTSSPTPDLDKPDHQPGTSFTPLQRESLDEFLARVITLPITTAPHSVTWSLDDAIHAALVYSYSIDELRIKTVEDFQDIGIQYGKFDAVSFFNQSFQDSNTPVGNSFEASADIARIKGEQFNFEYGIRRELRSGGQVELSKSFGTRDDNSGVLQPRDQASADLKLRFSKELLKGSGYSVAMKDVLVATRTARSGKYSSVAEIADLLQNVADAYWSIFSARAELLAAVKNAADADRILTDLTARSNLDANPNLLEQARFAVEQQNVAADNAYATLAKAQFELVRLINAPELQENYQRIEIIPNADLQPIQSPPDVLSQQNTAIHNRNEVKAVIQDIKRAQLEHQFSLNELLPKLTFSAESGFGGLSGNRDLKAASRNMFDANATYELGFNFELPIENRSARFAKRRAELALARLDRQWKSAVELVKNDVLTAVQELETSNSVAQRQRKLFESSSQRLDFLEQRRYAIPQAGAIPSLQLAQFLDVQSQLAAAKAAYASAIAERGKSQFNLNRATGLLVQEDGRGLENPGKNQMLLIYRQQWAQDAILQEEAKHLSREIKSVSKKHDLATWKKNGFGYPTTDSDLDSSPTQILQTESDHFIQFNGSEADTIGPSYSPPRYQLSP